MSENMELIEYDGHFAKLAKRAEEELIRLELAKKELNKKHDELCQLIREAMEKTGDKKLETDRVSIAYVPGGPKETFDSGSLSVELPDLYREYIKTSMVKPYVRITIKNGATA